LILSLLVNNYL